MQRKSHLHMVEASWWTDVTMREGEDQIYEDYVESEPEWKNIWR